MDVLDLESAIALYEQKMLTIKGLVYFYLQNQQLAPHQVNPKRASIDLNISQASIYRGLKEMIRMQGHHSPTNSPYTMVQNHHHWQ